jgi:predicted ATPase
VLIEQLGIEPGPALQGLEQAILEQRDELDLDPTPTARLLHPVKAASVTPLPVPPTPLVGRALELGEAASLLGDHRLVTLTGMGGAGKTRLALAIAPTCDGETCFCDLALVSSPASVVHALGRDAGVAIRRDVLASGPADVIDELIGELMPRELLIVLDNCEHLLDATSVVVDRILTSCPGITVLATSREPLGVRSEQVFPVSPLPVPAGDDDLAAESVVLFTRRAMEARPDFTVDERNRVAVTQLCRRLDGLPLALELAAARMSHLSPEEVVERLDRRFQLLASRYPSRPERHRTLTAMIDWSYDLLSEPERAVFRRLAVFAGYFTVDAVQACCSPGLEDEDLALLLGDLVDKSLVVAEHGASATRLRLLETMRLYAEERLDGSDDESPTRDAHAQWCLDRVERISWDERILGPRTADALEHDHEDLRRALAWLEADGRPDLVARLIVSMTGLLVVRGYFDEIDRWFPVAIAYERSLPPGERFATALWSFAYLGRWDGDLDRIAAHRQQLAPLVENFPEGHAVTAVAYATLASLYSRPDGQRELWGRYADVALSHAPADARHIRTKARCHKARALLVRGRYADAIAVLDEGGLAESEEHDTVWSLRDDLALAHHLAGNQMRALGYAEARIGRSLAISARFASIFAALALGEMGESERAREHLREAVASLPRAHGHPLAHHDIRMAVGALIAIEGRVDLAATLIAGLTDVRMSTNAMAVLLLHYQARVRNEIPNGEWQRYEDASAECDAGRIVDAEINRSTASGS